MSQIIPFQPALRPDLPTIIGNVDYASLEADLKRIDQLLALSGAEEKFVQTCMEEFDRDCPHASSSQRSRHQKHSFQALRCNILMRLLGEDFRGMSRRLAECPLFQWFGGFDHLGGVKVPAKSTLHEYSQWLGVEAMEGVMQTLIESALSPQVSQGEHPLKLANDIELEQVFVDSTCVKANIHFPVDWLLLRDAARTLMKATLLIREHGLKHRMEDPQTFLKRMNRLCIEMTHARRQPDSKKARKGVLRRMKKLSKVISNHALRHRDLLDQNWQETDWTRPQTEEVLERIDQVLLQLPEAIEQAHERIIGERAVKNEDKILSLYESEIEVIVRGKAGAEVEFGNRLQLVEQKDGLIVDWRFLGKGAPSDSQELPKILEGLEKRFGQGAVKELTADRGYDSKSNRKLLEKKEVYNGVCPRQAKELKERMEEDSFAKLQNRRGQTEGRIGILKNKFLGRPLRSKGFESREAAVCWSVLTHNLWVLARMEQKEVQEELPQAA